MRDFRFTRDDYSVLIKAGVLEGVSVELIRGRLIEPPRISDQEASAAMCSACELRRVFAENVFTIRPRMPFIGTDDSVPEPDLCVVRGTAETILTHPSSCLLLIEISKATLAFDRTEKASLYAESGVADYWIVNLVDRTVEVHREPRSIDGVWGYAKTTIVRPGESVSPLSAAASSIDPAAASRVKADVLVLYTFDTDFYDRDYATPLTIVTLGLSPNKRAFVTTTATALILDARTGYVYGGAETTEKSDQAANAWTTEDAIDDTRQRTERRAFDKLVGELEKSWPAIVNLYSPATSAR